jgi:hypothetical protein
MLETGCWMPGQENVPSVPELPELPSELPSSEDFTDSENVPSVPCRPSVPLSSKTGGRIWEGYPA